MVFPWDFGFVPGTIGGDDDPLDALVLMDEPAFSGCVLSSVSLAQWKPRKTRSAKPSAMTASSQLPKPQSSSQNCTLSTTCLTRSSSRSTSSSPITTGYWASPRGRLAGSRLRPRNASSRRPAAAQADAPLQTESSTTLLPRLNRRAHHQHRRLIEVPPQHLHTNRQPCRSFTCRHTHAADPRQRSRNRIDVLEVHLQRIIRLLSQLECWRRRHRAHNRIHLRKRRQEISREQRANLLRLAVVRIVVARRERI